LVLLITEDVATFTTMMFPTKEEEELTVTIETISHRGVFFPFFARHEKKNRTFCDGKIKGFILLT
jgi:hypothetical protein